MYSQFWHGTNLSHVMVSMSRLRGGNSFLSAIKLLCNAVLETSNAATACYLQGLLLCLLVDFAASAPRTDYNALHFSQGVELLMNTMKRSSHFDDHIVKEYLDIADKYMSSPIVYIDPDSDAFKQLIRHFLAELQNAYLHTPQRAALLVDKILACYLDIQQLSEHYSGAISKRLLKRWTLMLLSFSKTCLKHRLLNIDRLAYIKELLLTIQPNICCPKLSRNITKFTKAVPVTSNLLSYKRRKKLIGILKKTVYAGINSCKGTAFQLDLSLCSFPTSGQLPFSQPYCTIPHFPESFNTFEYTPNLISVLTRVNTKQILLSPSTKIDEESPSVTIHCDNIPRFMTKEQFYSTFVGYYSLISPVSIDISSYAVTDAQTHSASLTMHVDTHAMDINAKLIVLNDAVNKLIEAPELTIWGHAIKITVCFEHSD